MKDTNIIADSKHIIKELIHYQDDAVTSRTIIDKKEGTITLFSFGTGQGLSEHTAPYDAFVQIIEGEMEILIKKRPYMLREGEIIIMPADQPHALRAVEKSKMLLVMIRAEKK